MNSHTLGYRFCRKFHPGIVLGVSLLVSCLMLSSCSLLKEKKDDDDELKAMIGKPLSPEKSEKLLNEVGSNWLYGEGLGETALTAGSIVLFPPYAVYVLGNGVLSLSGYEPIHVTDALPETERDQWDDAYKNVVSSPGRLTSAVAGREFRNEEVAKVKIKEVLKSEDQTTKKLKNGQNRSSNQTGN